MSSRSRLVRIALASALTLTATAAFTSAARASYHENLITEIHEGSGGGPGDFVELQAYAGGQNLVAGKKVVFYDGGGNPMDTFTFPANVPSGANQATILIAYDASVPGADFISTDVKLVNANGSVCFTDAVPTTGVDCVSWSSLMLPAGPPSPIGTPLALPAATIPSNTSIVRNTTRGCATALDLADDTNSSAADWAIGPASPRGNATAPTETLCATPAKKKCKKGFKLKKVKTKSGKKKKMCVRKKRKKK